MELELKPDFASGSEGRELIFLPEGTPCVACGIDCLVKIEVEEQETSAGDYSEKEILFYLCDLFRAKIVKARFRWGYEGGGNVPLCGGCRGYLVKLLDLQKKIKELEEGLKEAISEFTKKSKLSEEKVDKTGIYQKDWRYFQLRRTFRFTTKRSVKQRENVEIRRSSDRTKTGNNGNKSIRTSCQSALPKWSPTVSVSAEERTIADEFDQHQTRSCNELELDEVILPEETSGHSKSHIRQNLRRSAAPKKFNEEEFLLGFEDTVECGDDNGDSSDHFDFSKSASPITGVKDESLDHLEVISKPSTKTSALPLQSSSPKRKRGRQKGQVQVRKKRYIPISERIAEDDDDYVQPNEEDGNDNNGNESDEMEMDDGVQEGYFRLKTDPETGTCTYRNFVFIRVNDNEYSCQKCDEKIQNIKLGVGFTTSASVRFRKHIYQRHSDKCQCPHCESCFASISGLKSHIKIVHEGIREPKPICNICGRPNTNNSRLRKHLWTHYNDEERQQAIANGEKPPRERGMRSLNHQCDECGKKFKGLGEVKRHKLSAHTKDSEVPSELCQVCGKSMAFFKMQAHMRMYHPAGNPRFICHICNKEFGTRMLLRDHRETHKKFPFQCEVCGKGLRTKESFTGHMNVHNNIRPYACTQCPKTFGANAVLYKHFKTVHEKKYNYPYTPRKHKTKNAGTCDSITTMTPTTVPTTALETTTSKNHDILLEDFVQM